MTRKFKVIKEIRYQRLSPDNPMTYEEWQELHDDELQEKVWREGKVNSEDVTLSIGEIYTLEELLEMNEDYLKQQDVYLTSSGMYWDMSEEQLDLSIVNLQEIYDE